MWSSLPLVPIPPQGQFKYHLTYGDFRGPPKLEVTPLPRRTSHSFLFTSLRVCFIFCAQ